MPHEASRTLEVRADVFSIGGAVILMICIVLTVVAAMAMSAQELPGAQGIIAVLLTIGAWIYYVSSVTERLRFVDHAIEQGSRFARSQRVSLHEVEAISLVHQGFNLERGIETIEFRRRGGDSDRIALGPCWQRHKLEAFLDAVEDEMQMTRQISSV